MKDSQLESDICQTDLTFRMFYNILSPLSDGEIEPHRSCIIFVGQMMLNGKSEILTYVHVKNSSQRLCHAGILVAITIYCMLNTSPTYITPLILTKDNFNGRYYAHSTDKEKREK